MGSLGESWGHLWPTWVPKRLLERQVGAKKGQVGAQMSQDEVKLEPSWGKIGAKLAPRYLQEGSNRRQVEVPGSFLERFGATWVQKCRFAGIVPFPTRKLRGPREASGPMFGLFGCKKDDNI